ncbi:MAG TPA: energy transducer TonB [Burkholderiaceae bacterium]
MTSAYADNAPAYDPGAACKKPEYPRASLVNEEAGTVTIAFNVAADGKVTDSKIVKSSGFKNLDKAAQKDLGACKFKAGVKDGKPVDGVATVDWVWKLD